MLVSRRSLLQAGLAAPFVLRAGSASAAMMDIKFSLSAPFDGSNAMFFMADQKGWYKEAGFDCSFDASGGAGEVMTRVGSGVYQMGIGDLNIMAEFNAKNPAAAIRSIYMLYYRSPLCAIASKKSGITKPSDLAGRTIGAAAADGAYRLFGAYTKATGLDPSTIKWNMVGLQLREAVLARGDAEAILGFDSTMYFGLRKAGLTLDDLTFLYYSDAGLDFYSNGIVVSDKMRKESPDAVKRFVAVTARAWQAAIANPKEAIDALIKHAPLLNASLEEEKLRWLIKNQLVTDESRADGSGGVRPARLAKSMEVLAQTYGLPSTPKPEEIFDPSFLPSADLRKIPV